VSQANPASHRVLLLSITTKTTRQFRFMGYVFLLELVSDFPDDVICGAYTSETNNALAAESLVLYSERLKEQLTSRRAS
jgi:hypothetical protein